jgi:hypothetical protein
MPDVWLTALLKSPPAIYGRQLTPLSLAHASILASAGNAYWCGGEVCRASLIEAVDICSRTWEQNSRWIARPRLASLKRLAFVGYRSRFETASAAFESYLTDYMASPLRDVRGEFRRMATPWPWRLAIFLIDRGFSESQAWNMPVCRARCYFDAHDEMNGADNMIEREREEAYDMIAEANKLDAAGRKDEAAALYDAAQKKLNELRAA